MTGSGDSSDSGKSSRRAYKWLAGAISLMAAAVPIIGEFEHWFDGGSSATASTPAEYGDVCALSNAEQHRQERNLTKFRVSFEHAGDLTGARDAILLLTRQTIAATAELQGRIEALTPPRSLAGAQRTLDEDWTMNLDALGRYRERLSGGLSSAAQLVKVTASLPHTPIAQRSADARAQLLVLGRSACMLDAERPQPNADWPRALRRELVAESSGKVVGNVTPNAVSATGGEGALPVSETSEALPIPEPETTESRPPQRGVATSGRAGAGVGIESGGPSSGVQSTTTAP